MNVNYKHISWWSRQLTPFKRIWLTIGFFIFILFAGSVGYIIIEDWSPGESLYMTIITLSTVGFQEVRQLSAAGRVFTACLILVGIGTVGYGLGNLAAFFIEGELKELFKARKMTKLID